MLRTPSYRHHKARNLAVVTLNGRDRYLGPYGSPESRAEYDRLIALWRANGGELPDETPDAPLLVADLIVRFMAHAEEYYRLPNGTQTREVSDYCVSLRPLNFLFGNLPARDFGPIKLQAVRRLMVEGYKHSKYGDQPALARKVVNQRVGRVCRVFKWAASNELLPPSVYAGLKAVEGLRRGRSAAKETDAVKPVADEVVEATLPHLPRQVAAMVRLQRLTGMRPGEVVVMRLCDLDRSEDVWQFRPGSDQGPHGQHKTAWRGHDHVVSLGPRAQAIVREFFKADPTVYLFSPRDAREEQDAERRAKRQTPMTPSQQARQRVRHPERQPGDRYTTASYGRAVARAAKKANEKAHEAQPDLPEDLILVPHWHPNQLRHAKATEVRKGYGLEHAQVVLGQKHAAVTQIYAERDLELAAQVARQTG